MHQGKSPQGFGEVALRAEFAGFPIVGGDLDVPMSRGGDGRCFAVVHECGEFDVESVFGWVQVDDLENGTALVLVEIDRGSYQFAVDGVAQMSNFGSCLPGEDKGEVERLSNVWKLVGGGEVDRDACIEQETLATQGSSRSFGQVDDLRGSVLRDVAGLGELLVGLAGTDYVGA